MDTNEVHILKRALEREKAARKAAEKILEEKSAQLYEVNKKLEESHNELLKLYGKTDSQLQGVFENIVDAYVIMDLWGNVLKMNDAAVDLLQFENVNSNENLMHLVDPEELNKIPIAFQNLLEHGSVTDFKLKIITKRGKKRYVHVNGSIIYEDGAPVAAQGILRDITSETNYRKQIEAERQKYISIINNMRLGLLEVNTEDEILFANQHFSTISGFDQNELLGQVAGKMFPRNEDKKVIEIENSKRLEGVSNSYEIEVFTKSGELRNWLISGAPNYDLKGNVVGSIGIHLDITDFKTLQNQKEKLLIELEKSNSELQEYAHIVSHDLKSPLRSIDALVSWLKEDNLDKLDQNSIKNISLIEATLEKMEGLISDVLNYSSISIDSFEKEMVNLNDLVLDLTKILYIPDHISIRFIKKLPSLKGDKIKLQQLFQNIISNAVKFIDKEKGLIKIDYKERRNHIEFSVKDNGVGIAPQYHDKIFKIFHSLSKSKDSSGIGLSIVKKVVDLHEGKVWLESEIGLGTTFYFTLKK